MSWRAVVGACPRSAGETTEKRVAQIRTIFEPVLFRVNLEIRPLQTRTASSSRLQQRTDTCWAARDSGLRKAVRGSKRRRMWQGIALVRGYMCSLTKEGIAATTSSFPARLCPVRGTGWTTSTVACGSIPQPSEGRCLSCSDTGSHAPIECLVMHKAIHTALLTVQWTRNHHWSYHSDFIGLHVLF